MVKRRELQAVNRLHPTQEQIESFASAADGGTFPSQQGEKKIVKTNATRDYKAIRVPFNEYEFSRLEELAVKTGRSKLNAIRWAILTLADEVQ